MSRLTPNTLSSTALMLAASVAAGDDLQNFVREAQELNKQQEKARKETYKANKAIQQKTLNVSSSPKHDAQKSASNISQPSSSVGRRR